MSLPKGYTELEWIKSSGTQYIDTGVYANYQSRLILDAEMDPDFTGATIQKAGYGSTSQNWYMWYAPTTSNWYRAAARRQVTFSSACNMNGRFVMDSDCGTVTFSIGDVTETRTAAVGTYSSKYTLYLFAQNSADQMSYPSAMTLYSFKMYADGALVRDFVPCIDPAGAVGLYDEVNGVFYPNLGTGTFEAGTVKVLTPDAPEELTAEVKNGAVVLSWTASDTAVGYFVYRNGELLADTAETSCRDAAALMYREHEYTVVPYNEHGEGCAAVLTVFAANERPLDDLITDRTAEDAANRTPKGVYNAFDLNRVSAAAAYVHGLFDELGYASPETPARVWHVNDIPDRGEMNAHHNAVVGLDVIRYAHEKVVLPPNLEKLTYERANNIEKFLLLCGEAAERIPAAYIYSDELYGGEFS